MKQVMLVAAVLAGVSAFAGGRVERSGVVEGFYGRPWGTEGRLSMMDFMGAHGMNVFVYGPKDDPYHHAKWREPYPEKEAADFRKLLAKAKEHKIDFYWAIHLGDFKDEFDALFAKLEAMYAIGIRSFAAFYDDFGSADAAKHAEISNRIAREFLAKKGDCAPLMICPNVYHGTGKPYQREIGKLLDKDILVMWTGDQVCCDFKAKDIEAITQDLGRPPFIWWNWSVNDYCRRKLLLGPAKGIEYAPVAGVVANPMENCEANKPGLATFADWCRDPANYNPDASYAKALAEAYPQDVAEAMAVFAKHNCDPGTSWNWYFRRDESAGVTDWSAEVRRLGEATDLLKRRLPKVDQKLFWEMEGWLDAQALQVQIAEKALAYEKERDPAVRQKLRKEALKLDERREKLGEKARAKFAAVTFEGDRRNCKPPATADRVLEPMIRRILGLGGFESQVTWETLDSFCKSNVHEVKGPVRGIVVEHPWLGQQDREYCQKSVMDRATREGIVYLHVWAHPWSWMSSAQVRLTDRLLDVIIDRFGLPNWVPVVSIGNSMGAHGALMYPQLTKKNVVAVAANCPPCDLEAHFGERPDLPRTLAAAYADEKDFGAALRAHSPLASVEGFKDIAYFVYQAEEDKAVSKTLHGDRFVEAAAKRAKGPLKLTYVVGKGCGHCQMSESDLEAYENAVFAPFDK